MIPQRMELTTDVAIVGGSLAGASLALHLTNLDIDFLLFDSMRFPRRKACGEGISPLGIAELHALGLSEKLSPLLEIPLKSYRLYRSNGSRDTIPLGSAGSFSAYGVPRFLLDHVLASEVPPSKAFYGCKITSVTKDEDGTFLVQSESHTVRAHYVVMANGANSSLPESLHLERGMPRRTKRCGVSISHSVKDTAPLANDVHIFYRKNYQILVTPVSPNLVTTSFLYKIGPNTHFSKFDIMNLCLEELSGLGLEEIYLNDIFSSSSIGGRKRKPYSDGAFCIGDTLEQFDPIGGMGMTQALVSARLLSSALDRIFHKEHALDTVIEDYVAALEKARRPLRGFTRLSMLNTHNTFIPDFIQSKLSRTKFIQRLIHSACHDGSYGGSFLSALLLHVLGG